MGQLWELASGTISLPVEAEIAMVQDLMQEAKRGTERDVKNFWQSQKG